jgi:hypothetical protein
MREERSGRHPGRLSGACSASCARAVAILFLASLLSACSFIQRDEFTSRQQAAASVPGIRDARAWVDGTDAELRAFLKGSLFTTSASSRLDVLAISGGAYDGAFGAGIVTGWTATGTRPQFAVVTGVSAGSLIAPFAFLGPKWDDELAKAFTSADTEIVGDALKVLGLLGPIDLRHDSLVRLVDGFVTPQLLAAVAAEHARGRRLLVLTTNLDAQRGVIWDMGAIAASRQPNARELFRDVLVASSSVPGVFGPTYIEAEAGDHRFREMHADGGVTTQVFILPDAVLARASRDTAADRPPVRIWVIMNNSVTPQFEVVEAGLLTTSARSMSTLIKADAKKTLYMTADFVGRDRFNLTYIDNGFFNFLAANPSLTPGFNQRYMQSLFRYGYDKARASHPWTNDVPLPGAASGLRLRAATGAQH